MTNIKIDETLQGNYIVYEGISNGDVIVIEGTQSLRDGDVVSLKQNN